MKKLNKHRSKGFTLVELIVVMAILIVLASIMSLVISGFVRDSKLETTNDKAKQMYSTVQDMVVQMEIENDQETLNPAFFGGSSMSELKYVKLKFSMNAGQITSSGFSILASYKSGAGSVLSAPVSYDASSTGDKKTAYNKVEKYITDSIASDFTGSCVVYIDYEDFTVDEVVYTGEIDDYTFDTGSYLTEYKYMGAANQSTFAKKFKAMKNIFDQRDKYKLNGKYVGCYPMLDDTGVLGTDYATA